VVGRYRLQPERKRRKGASQKEKTRFYSRAFSRPACIDEPCSLVFKIALDHLPALGARADEETHKDTNTVEKYNVTKNANRALRNSKRDFSQAASQNTLQNRTKVQLNSTVLLPSKTCKDNKVGARKFVITLLRASRRIVHQLQYDPCISRSYCLKVCPVHVEKCGDAA
jgi:hypothetical protein